MEIDPSILFPNDAPAKPAAAPDWFQASQHSAEQRLAGNHQQKPAQKAAEPATDQPRPEDIIFADDATEGAAAAVEKAVTDTLQTFAVSAVADGDAERGEELQAAMKSLTSDFSQAGTPAEELASALGVVRERSDRLGDISEAEALSDYQDSMAALQKEIGQTLDADLRVARSFIRDLERVAPGTIASLERHGAGNDPRLVKAAIKEAKRRGYR